MKKLPFLLLLPLLFILPHSAHAAIAFDAASNGTAFNACSLDVTHTTSGSDRILFVTAIVTTGGTTLTATYNSVSMTRIGSEITVPTSGTHIAMFYLINPAVGANNIHIGCTGTPSVLAERGQSYTGALQSGVPDASNSGTGTGLTASDAVTVVGAGAWIVSGQVNDADSFALTGTNYAQQVPAGGSTSSVTMGDTNGTVGTGSKTVSVAINSGTPHWGIISASFLPVTPPVVTVSNWGTLTFFQ